jgi:hypothetical protein
MSISNRIEPVYNGNSSSQKRRKLGQAAQTQKFCERLAKPIVKQLHELF